MRKKRGGVEIMITFDDELGSCRYAEILEEYLNSINAKKILDQRYESDYQGFVDISVLLEDGRVFSYEYWYGSCSGCDEWESQDYSDDKIKEIMEVEATFFDNEHQYNEFKLKAT